MAVRSRMRSRCSSHETWPADRASSLAPVRTVFTAYLVLIALGLGLYIAIGITN